MSQVTISGPGPHLEILEARDVPATVMAGAPAVLPLVSNTTQAGTAALADVAAGTPNGVLAGETLPITSLTPALEARLPTAPAFVASAIPATLNYLPQPSPESFTQAALGFPGRIVLPGTGVPTRSPGGTGPLTQSPGLYLSGGGGDAPEQVSAIGTSKLPGRPVVTLDPDLLEPTEGEAPQEATTV